MNQKSKTKAVAAVSVGLVALIGIGMLTGATNEPVVSEPVIETPVVEALSVDTDDIIVSGEYVGIVEAGQSVTVYPKVSAEVLAVNFGVGDQVEVGDVLFELDSTTLRSSIAQTQANITSAQQKARLNLEIAQQDLETYQSSVADGYHSSMMQAEAAVQSAEVALQAANALLRSARDAYRDYKDEYGDYDDDYSIDSQLNQLRNSKIQAEIKVESAQLKLEQAEATLEATKKQVAEGAATAENKVKTAELGTDLSANYISLQQLQNDLQHYTVTSAISGIVEQCSIDPHDMVSGQTPTFVISNKESMTVSFQVSETAWRNMRIGDPVQIEKNGAACSGNIQELPTMVNTGSGLYTVKATVENAPFDMPTGSTIKVWAEVQRAMGAIAIPIDSLYYEGDTAYVFTYRDGIAQKVIVQTGISDNDLIEITSGLQRGDKVITTWNTAIMDGTEVLLPADYEKLLQEMNQAASEVAVENSVALGTSDELLVVIDENATSTLEEE